MSGKFDYYDILGIDANASQEEIHYAYRAAIKQYHPDVNPAPNASRYCEMLNEAYAVLKDPLERSSYDGVSMGCAPPTHAAVCDRCMENAVHLRVAQFYRFKGFLWYSRSSLIQGTFCQGCRSDLAWQTARASLIFGIFALKTSRLWLKSIYFACLGGRILREETATLLKSQCAWYLQQGEIDAAYTNLSYLLEYEDEESDETDELLNCAIYESAQLLPMPLFMPGQCLAISSLAAMALIVALCCFHPLRVWGGTMTLFHPVLPTRDAVSNPPSPPSTTHAQPLIADDSQEPAPPPSTARTPLAIHSTNDGLHWDSIPFGDASLYKIVSTQQDLVHVLNYDGHSEYFKKQELLAHGLTATAKSGTWFYLQTTDQGSTTIKVHHVFHDPHKDYPLLRSRNGGKTWEFIPVNTGTLYKIVRVKQGYVQTSMYPNGTEYVFMLNEMEMHGIQVRHDIGKWYYIGIDAGGRAEVQTQAEYLEIQSQCENHICTD